MNYSISKHIYTVLSADESIAALVDGRIYPIGTKTEVEYPFIVYSTDSEDTVYSKDSCEVVRSWCTVSSVADTDSGAKALALLVRNALERVTAEYDDFNVTNAIVNGRGSSSSSSGYVEEVAFRFTITTE